MKNVIPIVVLVMLFGVCNAQSSKEKSNVFESHFGMRHYINYPSLSVIEDAATSYTLPSYGFLYGRRMDELMFGIQWDMETGSTSFIAGNERVNNYRLSLLMRRYKKINENVELYTGILAGTNLFVNGYKYMNHDYYSTRVGLGMEFSLGLNYMLSSNTYVGVHTGMNIPCVTLTQKGDDIPAPLNATDKRAFNGINISFNYGFRF